ncbi:MAG: hypothetical protein ACJ76Y_30925 [Thermoanaerobaculia bacterium]
MPKQSYAQEVADLEEVLAAVRASAEILPPLVLSAAEELAEQIAEIKRHKERQRSYAAEGMVATAAMDPVIARGTADARYIRACAVLLHGRKSGRLAQFGIRPRRRPRRKIGDSPEAIANPLGHPEETAVAAPDAAWPACAGRADDTENGAEVLAGGGGAGLVGGKAAAPGEEAAGGRAPVQAVRGFPAGFGELPSGGGEKALVARGEAQGSGATLQTDRGAAIRAA